MEKKNTVLLTVIAVATLLVAVVGATFAYYTATSNDTKNNANVNLNTAEVGGTEFKFTSETGDSSKINYPGGIAIIAAKADGSKDAQNKTSNNYDFSYKLKIASSTVLTATINWALYESDSADPKQFASKLSSCQLVPDTQAGGQSTNYYYTNDGQKYTSPEEIEGESNKDCTYAKLSLDLGTKIASGTITADDVTGTEGLDDETDTLSTSRTVSTSGETHGIKYYYLVLEYPNKNSNQATAEAGKAINVTLSVEGDVAVTPKKAA